MSAGSGRGAKSPPMPSTALDEVWRQQSRWSQAANRLERDIDRRRTLALGCTIAGAVLSAAAVMAGLGSTGGQLLAFASASAVDLAGLARSQIGRDALGRWTRARSVSEAIKSEVYTHLALGGRGEQALEERVAKLQDDAADHWSRRPSPRSAPSQRSTTYSRTCECASAPKVDGYYRPRAARLARTLSAVRRVEAGLAVAAVVAAAAAGTWNRATIAVWVPVITTVAATVTDRLARGGVCDQLWARARGRWRGRLTLRPCSLWSGLT